MMVQRVFRGLTVLLYSASLVAGAQNIRAIDVGTGKGLTVRGYTGADGRLQRMPHPLPVLSLRVNDTLVSSSSFTSWKEGDSIRWKAPRYLEGTLRIHSPFARGVHASVVFRNTSRDTVRLSDVVPLGEGSDRIFIRAHGPQTYQHRLSRSALFRPGRGPIGVVLPDNAWEMGFCDVTVGGGRSLTAIARRADSASAELRRFRAVIAPNGWVQYTIYADDHAGDWRDGLRMMFQERWLYDLETFDNTLFQRTDLGLLRCVDP
ncbi:MAG: yfmG [Bacteroidetes bacterium]|nr:yfmG [Bacteroidota bacterium]